MIILILFNVLFIKIKAQNIVATDVYIEKNAYLFQYFNYHLGGGFTSHGGGRLIIFSDSINLENKNIKYDELMKEKEALVFNYLDKQNITRIKYLAQRPFKQTGINYIFDISDSILNKLYQTSELEYLGIKFNENNITNFIKTPDLYLYKELFDDKIKVKIYKICISGIVFCIKDDNYTELFFLGNMDTNYLKKQPFAYIFIPFSICKLQIPP